ncbi:MAG: hypothetical protein HYR62_03215 [Actinobacteria bacterium]|nr:hypothetical protein [Actinomycetota bacterium]MBI3686146.1 hypothetical protein [Actinomycetota bacterium]
MQLAYLLYSISERRRWTQTALLFNGLGTSWNDLSAASRTTAARSVGGGPPTLDFDED